MKQRSLDPSKLDVAAFAQEGERLEGQWPVDSLPRLAEAGYSDAPVDDPGTVSWHAEGEARPRRGGSPDVWLHLGAQASVWLQCQRCLQAMRVSLSVDRSFRFVRDEAEAEAEDPESEEDVLAMPRALDLRALLEDELILELPIVPRHEVCPQPLLPPESPEEEAPQRPNPFAQLEVLKRGKGPH